MWATTLPTELVHEIASLSREHGASTLAALCVTCRHFNAGATPVLYETIDTRKLWPLQPHHTRINPKTGKVVATRTGTLLYNKRYILFVGAILHNPLVAGYVRHFGSYADPRLVLNNDILWTSMGDAFEEMRNLKTLIVQHAMSATVLERCHAQLEHFSWSGSLHIDGPFLQEHFLVRQTSLRVLNIEWPQYHPMAPDCLPNLSTLIAKQDTVLTFGIGSRPITSLFWRASDIEDDEDVPELPIGKLAPTLGQLHTLEILSDYADDYLLLMTPYLINVKYLNLVGADIVSQEFVSDDDSPVIPTSKLPSLIHLKLSIRDTIAYHPLESVEDEDRYLNKLFEAFPLLQTIDVEDLDIGYRRYLRGQVATPARIMDSIFEWCPESLCHT